MENFNIIISGVGGQGIITLLQIIDHACLNSGYDVKSSELHGLSQRGGAVTAHVRFGKKVYSPMISAGKVNLMLGLELTEGLRNFNMTNRDTVFLVNKTSIPFLGGIPSADMEVIYNKNVRKEKLHFVPASEVCKKELGKEVLSGMYLLGYAIKNNLMPIRAEAVMEAIKKSIPEKYQEENIKAFNLAKN